jgi:hypothetical protein
MLLNSDSYSMNKNVSVFGKTIPVWVLIAGIVGSGSMAIAVQPVSDEKIHIQDTTGKIQTNVPVAASRAFSPLAIEFAEDTEPAVAGATAGSTIVTKQKAVVNMALDVSEDAAVTFTVENNSEDQQIYLIKAGAPAHVILDMESGSGTVQGLVGHNEWLATAASGTSTFIMEVSTTDAGFYPIVVELERVG